MECIASPNMIKPNLQLVTPLVIEAIFICTLLTMIAHMIGIVDVDAHDLLLALPLIRHYAFPDLYSPNDLLIAASETTPFVLYSWLGFLFRAGVNIESYLGALYQFLLAAALVPIWLMAFRISGSKFLSGAFITTLVLSNTGAGALQWTSFPTRCLISSSAALPFLFAALYSSLTSRHLISIIYSCLTAVLHPGFGLISLTLCGSWSIRLLPQAWKLRLLYWSPVFIIFAAILSNWFPAFLIHDRPSYDRAQFWEIFREFSVHAFIETHWPEAYLLCFIELILTLKFLKYLPPYAQKFFSHCLIVILLLCSIYILNLYYLKIPEVALAFLFRSTVILKVIGTLSIFVGIRAQVTLARDRVAIVFLIISLLLWISALKTLLDFFIVASLTCLVLSCETNRLFRILVAMLTLSVLGTLALFGSSNGFLAFLVPGVSIIYALRFTCVNLGERSDVKHYKRSESAFNWITALFLCANFGAFALHGKEFYLRIDNLERHLPRDFVSLAEWARTSTPRNSLFLTDPADNNFQPFRVIAERSLFILPVDINQLAYSPKHYLYGAHRLKSISFQLPGKSVKPGSSSDHPDLLSERILESVGNFGVTHIISSQGSSYLKLPRVYENTSYVVYQAPNG